MSLLPIWSALIAAAVSFVTAWWAGRRSARLEIDKAVLGGQQKVMEKLLEARIKEYSSGYRLCSQFLKDARDGVVDLEYLRAARVEFDKWDSSISHLMGPETSNVSFRFRSILMSTIAQAGGIGIDLSKLAAVALEFELALRSDLGVYGLHFERSTERLATPVVPNY